MPSPAYRIVQVTGAVHDRRFTVEVTVAGQVMGSGTGARRSQAEQEAAAAALEALGRGALAS
jgi:ribonuclease-3